MSKPPNQLVTARAIENDIPAAVWDSHLIIAAGAIVRFGLQAKRFRFDRLEIADIVGEPGVLTQWVAVHLPIAVSRGYKVDVSGRWIRLFEADLRRGVFHVRSDASTT